MLCELYGTTDYGRLYAEEHNERHDEIFRLRFDCKTTITRFYTYTFYTIYRHGLFVLLILKYPNEIRSK